MRVAGEEVGQSLERQLEVLITASQNTLGARIVCGPDRIHVNTLLCAFDAHPRAAHLAAVAVGMCVINGDAQVRTTLRAHELLLASLNKLVEGTFVEGTRTVAADALMSMGLSEDDFAVIFTEIDDEDSAPAPAIAAAAPAVPPAVPAASSPTMNDAPVGEFTASTSQPSYADDDAQPPPPPPLSDINDAPTGVGYGVGYGSAPSVTAMFQSSEMAAAIKQSEDAWRDVREQRGVWAVPPLGAIAAATSGVVVNAADPASPPPAAQPATYSDCVLVLPDVSISPLSSECGTFSTSPVSSEGSESHHQQEVTGLDSSAIDEFRTPAAEEAPETPPAAAVPMWSVQSGEDLLRLKHSVMSQVAEQHAHAAAAIDQRSAAMARAAKLQQELLTVSGAPVVSPCPVAPFAGVQPLGLAAAAAVDAIAEAAATRLEDEFWSRQRAVTVQSPRAAQAADGATVAAAAEDVERHRMAVRQEMEMLDDPEGAAACQILGDQHAFLRAEHNALLHGNVLRSMEQREFLGATDRTLDQQLRRQAVGEGREFRRQQHLMRYAAHELLQEESVAEMSAVRQQLHQCEQDAIHNSAARLSEHTKQCEDSRNARLDYLAASLQSPHPAVVMDHQAARIAAIGEKLNPSNGEAAGAIGSPEKRSQVLEAKHEWACERERQRERRRERERERSLDKLQAKNTRWQQRSMADNHLKEEGQRQKWRLQQADLRNTRQIKNEIEEAEIMQSQWHRERMARSAWKRQMDAELAHSCNTGVSLLPEGASTAAQLVAENRHLQQQNEILVKMAAIPPVPFV